MNNCKFNLFAVVLLADLGSIPDLSKWDTSGFLWQLTEISLVFG